MKYKATMSDVAKRLNLSKTTVFHALHDHNNVSSETILLVKKTAEEMGYGQAIKMRELSGEHVKILSKDLAVNFSFPSDLMRRPNVSDIARESGLPLGTVRNILPLNCDMHRRYARETISLVYETAARIGWAHRNTPRYAKIAEVIEQNRKINSYLERSNFPSKEEEKKRMLILREQGYSNPVIAKKVGCSYAKVLSWIGVQPKEYTLKSTRLAGSVRRGEREARERLVLSLRIEKFEQVRKEAEAINAHALELEAQAQRIAQEAKAIREQYSSKVIELDAYRKEAETAAKKLGRNLA